MDVTKIAETDFLSFRFQIGHLAGDQFATSGGNRDLPDRLKSVVYLESAPRGAFEQTPPGHAVMDQLNETFAPLLRLLGMKFQLGVQELQPAASRALATAHTRTKGVIALASPARAPARGGP